MAPRNDHVKVIRARSNHMPIMCSCEMLSSGHFLFHVNINGVPACEKVAACVCVCVFTAI